MATFYSDASAIAKLYLQDEIGVDFVLELLGSPSSDDRLFTSSLSIVEVKAAISRRIDSADDRAVLLRLYDRDVRELLSLLPVDDDIIMGAGAVAERHRLRTGDAIHLATAMDIANDFQQVFMVSSDIELLEASEAAGLGALNPQVDDALGRLNEIRDM